MNLEAVKSPTGELQGGGKSHVSRSPFDLLSSKSSHARNLFSQVASRLIAIASFAVSLPIFISKKGAAAYGVLALLLSIYSVLILLDLGVSYSVGLRVGRALARRRLGAAGILGGAIPLTLILAGAVLFVIETLAPAISHFLYGSVGYVTPVRIFGATVAVYIVSSTPAAVVLLHHRVDWFNYSKLILDLAKAGGLLVGSFSADGVGAAMWVLLIGALVKCSVDFGLSIHLLGGLSIRNLRLRNRDIRANLGLGIPMSAAGVVSVALASGDRVAVSRLYGPEQLAHYSLAVDICSKAYFLVWSITNTVYPLVVRGAAARRDVSIYRNAGLIAVVLVGALIYLPIALAAPALIRWWLNPSMAAGAGPVTSLWALVAVIYLLMSVLYNQLQAKGRPYLLLAVNLLGLAMLAIGVRTIPSAFGIRSIAILMGSIYVVQASVLWALDRGVNREIATRGRGSGCANAI